ncbi:cell death regulator Aven [Microcaecilia unicolor]|uniref:Cell death regulator Aven n=1 Tax=Microcaecilia unicolor TaxID=1415580 RepID=A0A6P7Z0A8_9AMPH|nr:cell death regulator Aven [Microcaecilia unicolor]
MPGVHTERGRGRGRRGRGGYRGRPEEQPAVADSGGWKTARGRRGRGGGAGVPRDRQQASEAEVIDEAPKPDEEDELGGYARRKIVSNWSRYKDTEEELSAEGGESRRGADFSVLLSSAGDSFAQFRLAEEKEWEAEYSSNKQISGLQVDCQSLVQALQDLPLYLRVNVEAQLVQAEIPSEMPELKIRTKMEQMSLATGLQSSLPRAGQTSDVLAHSASSSVDDYGRSQVPQKASCHRQQQAECLDPEVDFLLSLETSALDKTSFQSKSVTHDPESLKQDLSEPAAAEVEANKFGTRASEEQKTTVSKVSEEELEDWLDSMIA